ncbi:MotA/TolQ/ExbB proton channel family protein [Verrucomicrobiota bacterium]
MFLDLVEQGGAVLWFILGMGLAAFVVFVERSLHLHRARIRSDDFLKGIFNILGRQNVTEALAICEETPGPVAYIVRTAILHRDDTKAAIRSAVDDAGQGEISRMERRLMFVATVAQTAPLLGLLGTVLGMVESLIVMQHQSPLIQPVDVLSGLMTALITTAAGLTVAIPCYAGFNLLVVKIDRIVLDMERAASEAIAFLTAPERKGNRGNGRDSEG